MFMVGNNMPNFLATYHAVLEYWGDAFFWIFYLLGQWIILNIIVSLFIDAYGVCYDEFAKTETPIAVSPQVSPREESAKVLPAFQLAEKSDEDDEESDKQLPAN